jgi:hypothetical protein
MGTVTPRASDRRPMPCEHRWCARRCRTSTHDTHSPARPSECPTRRALQPLANPLLHDRRTHDPNPDPARRVAAWLSDAPQARQAGVTGSSPVSPIPKGAWLRRCLQTRPQVGGHANRLRAIFGPDVRGSGGRWRTLVDGIRRRLAHACAFWRDLAGGHLRSLRALGYRQLTLAVRGASEG